MQVHYLILIYKLLFLAWLFVKQVFVEDVCEK